MDILDVLASDNYILYNKTLAKEIGVENAILFGALCGYQRLFKGQEFFREQDKIIDDTCLTEYAVRKGVKELQELKLINVTKKGLPAKYYYQVNITRLLEMLSTSACENDTTSGYENSTTRDCENDTTYILDKSNINNKEVILNNNIKEKNSVKKERFVPPTYDEVLEYAKERKREDLAKKFYDYYTATNWIDSKGNKVKSWKGKFITWQNQNEQPYQKNDNVLLHKREYSKTEINDIYDYSNKIVDDLLND